MMTFQEMISALTSYWAKKGCTIHQGYDLEVGAGTFNPATFLRCLGPEPYQAVYVEPSRRPQDGRYGQNPNRVQFYHQMQVIMKPSPKTILNDYLESLEHVGLDLKKHDIRFVHDDWENPTIGAWGLGWEVWIDGMEATQFTYFQAVGGLSVKPVTAEITYGLERLAMYLQGVDSIFDIQYSNDLLYGQIYKQNEKQWSKYNFEEADSSMWQRHFNDFEAEARRLIKKEMPIVAYDFVMKASHAFNMLDARGVISVSERTRIMAKIRHLAHELAKAYLHLRQQEAFPLLQETPSAEERKKRPVEKQERAEDFLLEIGLEELPATFVPIGMAQLKAKTETFLKKHKLRYQTLSLYATPRRLALHIEQLEPCIKGETIEKKGPAVHVAFDAEGNPTKAAKGFLAGLGVNSATLQEIKEGKNDALCIKTIKDTPYLFATAQTPEIATSTLLSEHLTALILSLEFPKSMRWADLEVEFARPIRWIVALYGKSIIPFSVAAIDSGCTSWGHRLLANHPIELDHPRNYLQTLEKHHVMADCNQRRQTIVEQIDQIERERELTVVSKESVLKQVVHLVEWPFEIVADFDPAFLRAPKEVLTSEMIEHQKYFPLEKTNGELAPHFIVISNNKRSDLIAKGHQKTLSSRLQDGLFLFEEDLKEGLDKLNQKLEAITFHTELGSMQTKVSRLKELCKMVHHHLPICDLDKLQRAASLCKADLPSQLVGEFPHLQGIIGAIYARHQNEDTQVAGAIEAHWMPRQEKGELPQEPLGQLLCIADKLDNLLSLFALNLKPTSSSDPFALRRGAFGLLKIIIENKQHISLSSLLEEGFSIFIQNPELSEKDCQRISSNKETIIQEILLFLHVRFKSLLAQAGFKKELIEAVTAKPVDDPITFYELAVALADFQTKHADGFEKLLAIHTRIKKILSGQKPQKFDAALLQEDAEKELFEAIQKVEQKWQEAGAKERFLLLLTLHKSVTIFFEEIKVMADDLKTKENRLSLLHYLYDLFEEQVAFERLV